ncbi:hypothetical protein NLJ89_g1330 [Agrocybe chaxingu]|uniref:F-box domain-containing protein n=1 Tax=Agrocybe chaxingu TaxID=84603 RepID=A0A9W8TFD5_9AGAR|nr:hypothetical protein NLJ89_g1330 [Agrocybe chaxingu]
MPPIRALPPELLRIIFEMTVSQGDRVLRSHTAPLLLCRVCQLWRDIAIMTPTLWSSVAVDGRFVRSVDNCMNILDLAAERAGDAPLGLDLREHVYQDSNISPPELLFLLAPSFSRYQDLRLSVQTARWYNDLLHFSPSKVGFQKLERLTLVVNHHELEQHRGQLTVPPLHLFKAAPLLTRVCLDLKHPGGSLKIHLPYSQLLDLDYRLTLRVPNSTSYAVKCWQATIACGTSLVSASLTLLSSTTFGDHPTLKPPENAKSRSSDIAKFTLTNGVAGNAGLIFRNLLFSLLRCIPNIRHFGLLPLARCSACRPPRTFAPQDSALVHYLTVPALNEEASEKADYLLPKLEELEIFYPCHVGLKRETLIKSYGKLVKTRAETNKRRGIQVSSRRANTMEPFLFKFSLILFEEFGGSLVAPQAPKLAVGIFRESRSSLKPHLVDLAKTTSRHTNVKEIRIVNGPDGDLACIFRGLEMPLLSSLSLQINSGSRQCKIIVDPSQAPTSRMYLKMHDFMTGILANLTRLTLLRLAVADGDVRPLFRGTPCLRHFAFMNMKECDSDSEDNDAGKGREEDKPNDEASKVTGNKETTKADKTDNDGNETDGSNSDSEDTDNDYSDDDDDMLPSYHFKEFTPYDTTLVRLLTVPNYILQILQSENDLLLPELHSLHLYYPCHEEDHATGAATYSELIRTRAELLQNMQSIKGRQTFQFTLSFCRNKEFKIMHLQQFLQFVLLLRVDFLSGL